MNNAKNKNKQNNSGQTKKTLTVNRKNAKSRGPPSVQLQVNRARDTKTYVTEGLHAVFAHYPAMQSYAGVLMDPFLQTSAAIPHYPILPSYQLNVRVTGRGVCNNTGIGFITCTQMGGIANDLKEIYVSNGPNAPSLVNTGTDVDTIGTPSPYSTADFSISSITSSSQFRVRLVALGLRIRYRGTTNNRAGMCRMFHVPYTGSSILDSSFDDAGKIPYKEEVFNTAWHSVTFLPDNDSDFEYVGRGDGFWDYANCPFNSNQTHYQGAYPQMGIMMSSEPNAPFEWEYSAHFELVGFRLPNRSTSLDLHTSVKKVVSGVKNLRNKDNTTRPHNVGGDKNSLVSKIASGLSSILPDNLGDIVSTIGSVASKVLPFLI